MLFASRPVDRVPLVEVAPAQPPAAVHDVALVELQRSSDSEPEEIVDGAALKLSVGAGATTITSTESDALPPPPVQVSVNSVFAWSAAAVALPFTGFIPLQPPLAVHEFAPVVLHCSVAEPFSATLSLTALSATVGLGNTLEAARLFVVSDSLDADSPHAASADKPAHNNSQAANRVHAKLRGACAKLARVERFEPERCSIVCSSAVRSGEFHPELRRPQFSIITCIRLQGLSAQCRGHSRRQRI